MAWSRPLEWSKASFAKCCMYVDGGATRTENNSYLEKPQSYGISHKKIVCDVFTVMNKRVA